VPSLRLDCVLALALNVSRSKAVQIVKSKVVAVNYIEQTSPDYTTKLNDTFTIKGYGKFILSEVSEPTKKNRLHILINKYL
jgi:RNA-binding protein YlmH